jgi:hypothetical protein
MMHSSGFRKWVLVFLLLPVLQALSQPGRKKSPGIRLWAEKHLYASYYRNKNLPGEYPGRNLNPAGRNQEAIRKNLRKSGPYSDRQNSLPLIEGRINRQKKEAAASRGLLAPGW